MADGSTAAGRGPGTDTAGTSTRAGPVDRWSGRGTTPLGSGDVVLSGAVGTSRSLGCGTSGRRDHSPSNGAALASSGTGDRAWDWDVSGTWDWGVASWRGGSPTAAG